MQKIFPIQGLTLSTPITVPIRSYTNSDLVQLFGLPEKNLYNKEYVFIDEFTFVSHNQLDKYIQNKHDLDEINIKFPNIETFALIGQRGSQLYEIYDLKVALSIIYFANRLAIESVKDFFKYSLVSYGYYSESGINSCYWDVKIGSIPITQNDFDGTIETLYLDDNEPESWKKPVYIKNNLIINADIQKYVNMLSIKLLGRDEMSLKLRSALKFIYDTFPYHNVDSNIITYSTVLETLLLKENESGTQRKQVSVRAACLIADKQNYEAKKYISNWIFYFYNYRNKIVHGGKSYLEFHAEEPVIFRHATSLITHIIFALIKEVLINNIKSISCIKEIVQINGTKDNLNNNFNYIQENDLQLYYEEN